MWSTFVQRSEAPFPFWKGCWRFCADLYRGPGGWGLFILLPLVWGVFAQQWSHGISDANDLKATEDWVRPLHESCEDGNICKDCVWREHRTRPKKTWADEMVRPSYRKSSCFLVFSSSFFWIFFFIILNKMFIKMSACDVIIYSLV